MSQIRPTAWSGSSTGGRPAAESQVRSASAGARTGMDVTRSLGRLASERLPGLGERVADRLSPAGGAHSPHNQLLASDEMTGGGAGHAGRSRRRHKKNPDQRCARKVSGAAAGVRSNILTLLPPRHRRLRTRAGRRGRVPRPPGRAGRRYRTFRLGISPASRTWAARRSRGVRSTQAWASAGSDA